MDTEALFRMSYDEYVESLLEKYGSVSHDYYINEGCLTRSGNSRTFDGLVIHHIDEDKEAGLSTMWKYRNPFSMPEEYQKADRLVYCNLVEHLLLHMKILEKELTRIVPERRVDKVVSVKGFALIAKILMTYVIDLFTSPKSEGNPNYGLGWWREADHRRAGYFGSVATSGTFGHQGFTETLTMTMRSDRSIRQVSPMMTIR